MSIYHESKGSPILKAIIVLLVGVLVYVLYQPYKIREEAEIYKRESRLRMMSLRAGQLHHISKFGRYTSSIDSLVAFVDSLYRGGKVDPAIFKPLSHGVFEVESLRYAPKSHRLYTLISVDSTVIKKYLLQDPDGFGSIGSLTDDSRVNKGSWEE